MALCVEHVVQQAPSLIFTTVSRGTRCSFIYLAELFINLFSKHSLKILFLCFFIKRNSVREKGILQKI